MADFVEVIKRTVDGLQDNTYASRRVVYVKARGAVLKQLQSMNPPPSNDMIARQMVKLEEAIVATEAMLASQSSYALPKIGSPNPSQTGDIQTTAAERAKLKRTAYLVELLIPAELARDFLANLSEIHAETWVPTYGLGRARWIWHRQCIGIVVRHWFEVLVSAAERITRLQKP